MPAKSNRFVDRQGNLSKTRRQVPGANSAAVGSDATNDQLAEALRKISQRLADIESLAPQQWIEFEVQCPAASTVTLEHSFNCPVRFYVTNWRYTGGAGAPGLSQNEAQSTINTLVLDSGKAGRAVIRVEASQYSLQAGAT